MVNKKNWNIGKKKEKKRKEKFIRYDVMEFSFIELVVGLVGFKIC